MVTVLVTGATGGIGRGLVHSLARRGATVLASGRNVQIGRALERHGVRFLAADLVSDDLRPLVNEVDVVAHLAARSSPWGDLDDFVRDNVLVTARLLDAAAEAGTRRFVYASTPAIFAERSDRFDLRAESPVAARPINAYASTKLQAEELVRAERRMETLVLRPSAVIGPDDRAILPRLMRVIGRGVLPLGNGGGALFHPTDARDAAEAFALGAIGTATGILNVAGAAPVAVADMARALGERLGLRLRLPLLPEPALNAFALAAEWQGRRTGREPAITRYSAAILSWSRTFDISETEALLGWRPAYGPADALAHAVER
jgi:nucleoside-diphosphate-sugar epimerase